MTRLQSIRAAFDLALELVEESVAVEGQPSVHYQRILDEQREAELRAVREAEPPKAA